MTSPNLPPTHDECQWAKREQRIINMAEIIVGRLSADRAAEQEFLARSTRIVREQIGLDR